MYAALSVLNGLSQPSTTFTGKLGLWKLSWKITAGLPGENMGKESIITNKKTFIGKLQYIKKK